MLEPFGEKRGPVVFVSDAHLGAPAGARERADWFAAFLRSLIGKIGGLLVVGDLFDFWFEYRRAIPKGHFQVCRALADIVGTGVPVLYFGGNHDFWSGSYLRSEIGMQVTERPRSLQIQGRSLFVAHGDGLGRGDLGYRVLKRVLRNPLAISLYRAIHPDLGIPFAHAFSAVSRKHTLPREVLVPRLIRDIARPHLEEGHDAVVIGHVHEPTHLRLAEGEFVILGDWLENFTYLVMENGALELRRHRPGIGDVAIPCGNPANPGAAIGAGR
ncbi:MAG: UDP-2,3-diacylglucosamine diphosphatase [Candidatus Eisenbacteria bacterium]